MSRAALAALAAALVLPATALASESASALELTAPAGPVAYGEQIALAGRADASLAGATIVLETQEGATWVELGSAVADVDGAFALPATLGRGALVRARATASGLASEPVAIRVAPRVRLTAAAGRAYAGIPVRLRVAPATYAGRVALRVRRDGKTLATVLARVSGGRADTTVPAPGLGAFAIVAALPARDGLSPVEARTRASATARPLSVGSTGADVRGLLRQLAALGFRVPTERLRFTGSTRDVVYAFQKAVGLPRTGSVGLRDWQALSRARPPRPRFQSPRTHIEVDKTRQLLIKVLDGAVAGVLPVSTGATGNTPEGRHRIRWKALATGTWLGPAILYRTLTFYEDRFAIHGFGSVPPWPASHGCVRVPIWAADWLYGSSTVGETVYVYR